MRDTVLSGIEREGREMAPHASCGTPLRRLDEADAAGHPAVRQPV